MPFEIFFFNDDFYQTIFKFSITELKYTSLIKMIILEENFKWHLEAFASELFTYCLVKYFSLYTYNSFVWNV